MLGKLIKYECKAMGRIMIPLYLVMIFVAGIFAFNIKHGMSDNAQTLLQRFAIITSFLFFAAVMAVFIVMFILIVQRFYKNLLGTEGYLMFTLPTNTLQQILSKALTAMLWITVGIGAGIAAGFLIVFILSDVPEFLREIESAWKMLVGNKINVVNIVLAVVLIFLGILESLCKIYASIAIGHQFNSHRLLMSIVAYIAIGIVEMVLTAIPFVNRFIGKINITISSDPGAVSPAFRQMLPLYAGVILGIAVYGTLTWYLLDRRLNLE